MLKKVNGWGKIHAVEHLQPLTDEIRDWIVLSFLPSKPKVEAFKKTLQLIKAVFNYGREKKLCDANPAEFISYTDYASQCDLETRSNEERSFSDEEIVLLREHALKNQSNPHAVTMLIAMETGMRVGELAALKKSDIVDGFLHVHSQQLLDNSSGSRRHVDIGHTKDQKQRPRGGRYVPITPACAQALQIAENLPGESEYILHNKDGNAIQSQYGDAPFYYKAYVYDADAGTTGYGRRLEAIEIRILPWNAPAPGNTTEPFKFAISYRTHVQNVGWQAYKTDGEMSGTEGKSLRLEGINIKVENSPYQGNVQYRTHVQNIGWEEEWAQNGATSGTQGKSLRLEAIRIRLTDDLGDKYDVYYRVHCQNIGWMGWAKNGDPAGTEGFSQRLMPTRLGSKEAGYGTRAAT